MYLLSCEEKALVFAEAIITQAGEKCDIFFLVAFYEFSAGKGGVLRQNRKARPSKGKASPNTIIVTQT